MKPIRVRVRVGVRASVGVRVRVRVRVVFSIPEAARTSLETYPHSLDPGLN